MKINLTEFNKQFDLLKVKKRMFAYELLKKAQLSINHFSLIRRTSEIGMNSIKKLESIGMDFDTILINNEESNSK